METYLLYIGKSALAAGAFYLLYLILFQNQKQFTFNRIYLPVSLALSFIIPLITFTKIKYIEAAPIDLNSFAYLADSLEITAAPQFQFEWVHYLFGFYLLGSAGFLFYLILGHLKAILIVKQSWIKFLFETRVNVTKKDVHPFSFFNKIVLSEKTLAHPNLKMIVNHENIHVKERHTLDILFAEILFLAQWFNPFAWLIKDAIKNNLEYKTDHQITQRHNAQQYQLAMVGLAHKQGVAPFLNALNGSQLKNRIIMMKKKTENKFSFVKQLLVLPLLAILVMGLSNKEVKTEIVQTTPKTELQPAETSQKEHIVKGKVTDQNGNPISGASIIVKGKTVGTITDVNGNYELGINDENETLVFSTVGFEKLEIPVNDLNKINVQLKGEKTVKINSTSNKTFTREKEYKHIVKGKVTDQNGNPISGASIIVKGKTIGTITDVNGNYQMGIDNENETLVFSMVGYKIKETPVNAQTIDIKLIADKNTKPDGVKVIGYANKPAKIKISPNQKNEPLYIVDGKEVKDITDLDPENIESISVLKDKSATDLYGEKGKNGVICIETKFKEDLNDKLVIVDGKEFKGDINDISPDEIASISVLKDESAKSYEKIYGETAKNGVILINTKTKYNSSEEKPEPLIVIDGIITNKPMDDIDPETIKSINVLKGESAIKLFGEKGTNGVVEITMKPEKIDTDLKLRKFIAKNIKYPVLAQEANREKTVQLAVKIDKKGHIVSIEETDKYQKTRVDEVVVVAYKNKELVVTGYGTKAEAEKAKKMEEQLLVDEAKRVLNNIPEIVIPELTGKTVGISVKFMLQE